MKLPFTKLEGLGNCYIFVEARRISKINLKKLARAISDYTTGIGSDGLIIVDTKKEPHLMRIYNRDGSEAEMCGNGLRQAALFIRRNSKSYKKRFDIVNMAGEFKTEMIVVDRQKAVIKTSMGAPDFSTDSVGLKTNQKLGFGVKLKLNSKRNFIADCVSMGNPHAVIWVNSYDFDWETAGAELSKHQKFSDGTNVHFCRIINSKRFQMKIYERGSGVTKACGSGAAAAFAAAVMKSELGKNAVAEMPGGNLKLTWDMSEGQIFQEGPVSIVGTGEYYV